MFKKVVFSIVMFTTLTACGTSTRRDADTENNNTPEATVNTLLGGHGSEPIRKQMKENSDSRTKRLKEEETGSREIQERDQNSGISDTAISQRTNNETRTRPQCQIYSVEAIIKGKKETVYGTACLQPDGRWETSN